jgi:peptidoglycan/LPS O-acetylase OafA/YrhL
MIETCADIYQPFRMSLVWPILVGGIMFLAIRFFVYYTSGEWTRQQAILAGLAGIAAAVVATSIANRWDGSPFYWLAFTAGLTFAAAVVLITVVLSIWQASDD